MYKTIIAIFPILLKDKSNHKQMDFSSKKYNIAYVL